MGVVKNKLHTADENLLTTETLCTDGDTQEEIAGLGICSMGKKDTPMID